MGYQYNTNESVKAYDQPKGIDSIMAKINVPNRTIFCRDNLEILEHINSESVDLIYLDPPFNKNKVFTAPTGSSAEGAEFSDIFREEDVKNEWLDTIEQDEPDLHGFLKSTRAIGNNNYTFCYLCYMSIRLMECKRILKEGGSIYLHCDPEMSHYLKIVLDCIFGDSNFRNEITWKRTFAHNDPNQYGKIADIILFYTKGDKYTFNKVYQPYDESYINNFFRYSDKQGQYRLVTLTGPGVNNKDEEWEGWHPKSKGRSWSVPKRIISKITGKKDNNDLTTNEKLDLMNKQGYIVFSKTGTPSFKSYLDDLPGVPCQSTWTDIPPVSAHSKEKTGYPTQKPLALLERIIKASTNEGDMVLDPFCGCATTCVAAEKLGRQWVGIDVSNMARELVNQRLNKETKQGELEVGKVIDIKPAEVSPPKRTDDGAKGEKQKYVYIISNPNFKGEYKVGIASDVKKRLNAYQTSDPNRAYKEEFSLLTPYFSEIEKQIHSDFDNHHEWVKGDLKEIIKAIKKYHKKGF